MVAILDFLAKHPQDKFGLSELSRRLQLAKPTCLGIVTTLTESGYLVRDAADKTYRLGPPSLIALGHLAQESLRVNPAARAELSRLSKTFETTAALAAVVDDRITLLELVGPPGSDVGVRVGQSYPFAPPPVGLMFVLWDDEALRGWLGRAPTIPLRTETERLDRVIAECRTAGYLVERLTPPGGQRLYALMAGMSTSMPDELRALLGELISDIGERVYLRSETEGAGGVAPAARRQCHLRTRLRPPPPAGDGGVASDRSRSHRFRDRQACKGFGGDRQRPHHTARWHQTAVVIWRGGLARRRRPQLPR